MDAQIALLLSQDGITNGAIYALLALALVMVFGVTRIIFIPQGEFVSYGALTMAMFQTGIVPSTIWLLVVMGIVVTTLDGFILLKTKQTQKLLPLLAINLAYPLVLAALLYVLPVKTMGMVLQTLFTLAILVPMGPMLYRLAFQPVASASVLTLLIISVAVHVMMVGLGLIFFGAEGLRTEAFSDAQLEWSMLTVNGQTLWVILSSFTLISALYFFFERTLYGKALRATALNRVGARLMGISPALSGKLTFFLAALIGALSGILIAPITTIYYDTGFIIGLKGFVAAIIGGLVSYPLAAFGAILVGLIEAFSSFWASEYKEIIVFTLIIPVLLWRSLRSHGMEEDE